MKIGQSIKQTQTLKQVQLHNIALLQLSSVELSQLIQEQALENPLIDIESASEAEETIDWDRLEMINWLSESNGGDYSDISVAREEFDAFYQLSSDGGLDDTLTSFLTRQIQDMPLSDEERQDIQLLIACLEENGYMLLSDEELTQSLSIPEERLTKAMGTIRELEPAGVGAKDIKDCLLLQLQRIGYNGPAIRIVEQYLQDLEKRNLRALAKKLGITYEELEQAIKVILELDPRPCAIFCKADTLAYITPDIKIEKENGRFVAKQLRSKYHFCIDSYYLRLMKSIEDPSAQKYLLDKLQRANALLFGIKQRDATIVRCAQEIADRQAQFFATGEGLKPMKMTEIAQKLKLHNSTISRAVRLILILDRNWTKICENDFRQARRSPQGILSYFQGLQRSMAESRLQSLSCFY